MPAFDARSLLFVITLALLARAAALGYVWWAARRYAPLSWWAAGSLLAAAGALLLGLRGMVGDFHSIVIGHALALSGWFVVDAGIVIAAERRPPWLPGVAMVAAAVAAAAWFSFVDPSYRWRTIAVTVPAVAFDLYAAGCCVRFDRTTRRRTTFRLLAGVLAALAGTSLWKLATTPDFAALGNFAEGAPLTLSLLALLAYCVGGSVLFVLLATQRVEEQYDASLHARGVVEAELRLALQSAQQFRQALDQVPAYVYMKDASHRYTYANQPTLELFRTTAAALEGADDAQFFPADAVARLRAVDERVLAGADSSEEFEVRDGPGGDRVYLDVKTPLRDAGTPPRIVGLCGISTDITGLKRQQANLEHMVEARTHELSIAKDLAEAANRAKSTFLANMSHELRTPLNGIMGMLKLAADVATDPRQVRYLQSATKASNRLLKMIADVLEVTYLEAGKVELEAAPFVIADVVDRVAAMLGAEAAAKQLPLTVTIDDDLRSCTLVGDALRLRQVLLCLVGNAIKFTARGKVGIRVVPADGRIDPTGTTVRFEVEDTGIGIAPDDERHLYLPFYQLDGSATRSYGGAGLGLFIAKRLVEAMHGELAMRSVPGAGSTFWFTVPLARADDRCDLHPGPPDPATPLRVTAVEPSVGG